MFTTHDAIALLLEKRPDLSQAEINLWYTKGAEAILAYLAALEPSQTATGQPEPEEPQAQPEEPQSKPKPRKHHATES